MPVFDMPITTDDSNLRKVLGQNLPVVLFLYDSRKGMDKPLEDALQKEAKKHAGEMLIARVDVASSPQTHREYGSPATPAVVTLEKSLTGRRVKSQAGGVRPADVRAHIDYLLGRGALPTPKVEAAKPVNGSGHDAKPQSVGDANFNNVVLKSSVPVLVDFWAPWCAPCRTIAPVVDQMAKEYAGRARVVKLNVDENPKTAERFGVRSIPTLIIFKNGQPVEKQVGANPGVIRRMLESSLR